MIYSRGKGAGIYRNSGFPPKADRWELWVFGGIDVVSNSSYSSRYWNYN